MWHAAPGGGCSAPAASRLCPPALADARCPGAFLAGDRLGVAGRSCHGIGIGGGLGGGGGGNGGVGIGGIGGGGQAGRGGRGLLYPGPDGNPAPSGGPATAGGGPGAGAGGRLVLRGGAASSWATGAVDIETQFSPANRSG